ncbi:hypothetical protein PG994_013438 [Apiospora phragmitis]|uniref:DUF7924 domain-containing protein n=1 Tax=Apiospora phragmitis TaxID=2905665 RepID=A0ABR1T8M1_9PEZI
MWVATNQCLGGSATCTEAVSRLNYLQQYPGARPVGNMAFSIAMNQASAELYVSWKTDELEYYMREAAAFYLKRPKGFLEFRRYVRNILDWGKGPRLEDLQEAFDTVLEEDRKIASAQAKQRPAPSSASGSSASLKRPQRAPDAKQAPVDGHSTSGSRGYAQPSGYQSASAASGSRSYQSGSYAGGGGSRSGPGSGSSFRGGRDRSPSPPVSTSGATQSKTPKPSGLR